MSVNAAAQESATPPLSKEMLQAGAEALRQALPGAAAESPPDFSKAVQAAFAAMYPHQWRPIETAPLNEEILLGLAGPDGFLRAIGFWEVHDEAPFDGGRWNVSEWWGAAPTHWMPIPPPPPIRRGHRPLHTRREKPCASKVDESQPC